MLKFKSGPLILKGLAQHNLPQYCLNFTLILTEKGFSKVYIGIYDSADVFDTIFFPLIHTCTHTHTHTHTDIHI